MARLREFFHEIHHRSVWQVLGIYLAGGWLVYDVVLGLAQGLGLPTWAPPVSLIILAVGLPLVLSAAFLHRDPDELAPEGRPRLHVGLGTLVALALAAVALARLLGVRFGLPEWLWQAAAALMGTVVTLGLLAEWRARRRDRSWLTDRRAFAGAGAAVLVVVLSGGGYMTSRTLGVGPFSTPISRGELQPQVQVVLADFAPIGADTVLAGAITELLRTDLQQSSTIHPLAWPDIRRGLRRMRFEGARLDAETATELAQREGLPAVIAGELRRVGPSYLLLASLVAARDGRVLLADRETARDSSDLVAAAERLSRRMRARIGEGLRSVRASAPLPEVTTASLAALSAYAEGTRANSIAQNFPRAEQLLKEAVALDSTFAAAYSVLAAVYLNSNEQARARAAAASAYRHRERLPMVERLLVEANYHATLGEDGPRELALQRVLDLQPGHSNALISLSDTRLRQRRFADAETLARAALQGGSQSTIALFNAVQALVAQQRLADADSLMARGEPPPFATMRVQLTLARHDFAWVRALIDSIAPGDPESTFGTAELALVEGRFAEAWRLAGVATSPTWLRFRLRYSGWDTAGVSRAYDRMREETGWDTLPRDVRPSQFAIPLLAELGRTAEAREQLAEWQSGAPDDPRLREFIDLCLGSIHLAEGRPDSAAAAFLRWHDAPFTTSIYWYNRGLAEAAEAFERLGRRDTAIVLYERALAPDIGAWPLYDPLIYPFALRHLGELHEAAGHPREAAAWYARFVELWEDADPPLQPQVQAARAALGRLVRRSG